jgi:hypothetical protein
MLAGLFTSVLEKSGLGQAQGGKGTGEPSGSGPAVAVLEPPKAPSAPTPTGPGVAPASLVKPTTSAGGNTSETGSQPAEVKACPQCGSTAPWGISSWCPNCFYHPRMGMPAPAALRPEPTPGAVGEVEPDSFLGALLALPQWAHVLWLGVVAVFVFSVFEATSLPKDSLQRAVWTIVQASLGIIAAGTAHVLVFFQAIPNTDKYGPFDLLFKPFDFWRYAIRRLPAKAWRLWMFCWGLTAAFSALVLIGGVRYSAIFETKSKKKSTWYQSSQFVPSESRATSVWNG